MRGSVNIASTCWSRSNEFWVMSTTRFLCAKVLARLNNSHPHTKHSPSTLTYTTMTRTESLFSCLQSMRTTDSPSRRDDHPKCQTTQLLLRCNPNHTHTNLLCSALLCSYHTRLFPTQVDDSDWCVCKRPKCVKPR